MVTHRSHITLLFATILVLWLPVSLRADDVKYFNIIEKLHHDLLKNYDKQIRPVVKHTDTLQIQASLKLTHLDYDEMHSRFSARGFFFTSWYDPRFIWDPTKYEGVQSIHVLGELIWTPDLEVYNLDGKLSVDRTFAAKTNALIMSDGLVIYVPLTNLVSRCHPNLDRWPFDQHECMVKIGSWTHNADKMFINPQNNETTVDLSDMIGSASSKWNLLNTSVVASIKYYACCKEPYESVAYTFNIQRRSSAAKFTIITPTFVIVALTLATLCIPPSTGVKLIVGATNLALISGYLIYFNSVLPSTGSTPMIVTFYGATLIMAALSLVLSIETFCWTRFPKTQSPPAFVLKCLTCCSLNRFLGVTLPKAHDLVEEQKLADKADLSNGEKSHAQQYWICLSVALHHLLFMVYCVVFAVLIKCCLF